MAVQQIRIQVRRDTAANWEANNSLLLAGEQGLETDTGRVKIGDGVLSWNNLDYAKTDPIVETTSQYDPAYKDEETAAEDVNHIGIIDQDLNLYRDTGLVYNAKASRLVLKSIAFPFDSIDSNERSLDIPLTRNADNNLVSPKSGVGLTAEAILTDLEETDLEEIPDVPEELPGDDADGQEPSEEPSPDDTFSIEELGFDASRHSRATAVRYNGSGVLLIDNVRDGYRSSIQFSEIGRPSKAIIKSQPGKRGIRFLTNMYGNNAYRKQFEMHENGYFYIMHGGVNTYRKSHFTGHHVTSSWYGGAFEVSSNNKAGSRYRNDYRYNPGISFHWYGTRGGKIHMNRDGNYWFTKDNIWRLSYLYSYGVTFGTSYRNSIRYSGRNQYSFYANNSKVATVSSSGLTIDRGDLSGYLDGREISLNVTAAGEYNINNICRTYILKTVKLNTNLGSDSAWIAIYYDSSGRSSDRSRDIANDAPEDAKLVAEVLLNNRNTMPILPPITGISPNGVLYTHVRRVDSNGNVKSNTNINFTLNLLQLQK